MKIPFYRYVENGQDGHEIYQCLHCGEYLDTIGIDFLYCPYCGIQFNGMILKKDVEYIEGKQQEKTFWKVEHDVRFSMDWPHDENWTIFCGTSPSDIKTTIENLKRAREIIEVDKKEEGCGIHQLRIVKEIVKERKWYKVDRRKYYHKTGKHFTSSLKF